MGRDVDHSTTGPRAPTEAQPLTFRSGACCGVYFLIMRGVVVYVGSSLKFSGRVGMHAGGRSQTKRGGKVIEFDDACWIETSASERTTIERQWITRLRPRCNGLMRNGKRVLQVPHGAPITDKRGAI